MSDGKLFFVGILKRLLRVIFKSYSIFPIVFNKYREYSDHYTI